MKDKIQNKPKEGNEDENYFHRRQMNDRGGGQDGPDDLGDPLKCETDLKISKTECSSRPFDLMLIKIDEECQKSEIQCSICYLEFTAKEDLKSHKIEAHWSYGADYPRGFQQKVKTKNEQNVEKYPCLEYEYQISR